MHQHVSQEDWCSGRQRWLKNFRCHVVFYIRSVDLLNRCWEHTRETCQVPYYLNLNMKKNHHLLRQIFVRFSTNLLNLSEIITKKYLRQYINDLHQLACHLSWSYNMLSCWFRYSIRCSSMSVITIREVNKIF